MRSWFPAITLPSNELLLRINPGGRHSHLDLVRQAIQPIHRRFEFAKPPGIGQVAAVQQDITIRDSERPAMGVADADETRPVAIPLSVFGILQRWDRRECRVFFVYHSGRRDVRLVFNVHCRWLESGDGRSFCTVADEHRALPKKKREEESLPRDGALRPSVRRTVFIKRV